MSSEPTTATVDQWTVRRVLEWTTGYLTENGSESPRLDAEILLAHARGCPRIQLYTQFDEVLPDAVRATMRSLVQRRAQREPVAYLVGHREFFSLDFTVTPDVFIPRPETESLVVETLAAIDECESPRVLDLCTGSGCVAVAIAVNAKSAVVTAVEQSEAASTIARKNAERHQVADRVTVLPGDLFQPLNREARFDVIVSNPPYIAENDETVAVDVKQHEPHVALYADEQGLAVIRRIIHDATNHLVPDGVLLFEFSPEQADAITKMFEESGRYNDVTILPDLTEQARVVKAQLSSE